MTASSLGGPADRYYVSFNNVKVGQLIGQGEVACINAWGVKNPNILIMDGDPTDNNAKLFAQGYNGVLDAEVRRRHLQEGRRADRHVGSADGPDHVRAAVHGAPEHQRRGHAERRQRRGRDRCAEEQEDPAEDVPDHRSGRVARRVCRTSSRATSAAPSTSRYFLEAQAAAALALYLRAGQTPPSTLVNSTTKDTHDRRQRQVGLHPADLGDRRQHGRHGRQGRRRDGERSCARAVSRAPARAAGIQ